MKLKERQIFVVIVLFTLVASTSQQDLLKKNSIGDYTPVYKLSRSCIGVPAVELPSADYIAGLVAARERFTYGKDDLELYLKSGKTEHLTAIGYKSLRDVGWTMAGLVIITLVALLNIIYFCYRGIKRCRRKMKKRAGKINEIEILRGDFKPDQK